VQYSILRQYATSEGGCGRPTDHQQHSGAIDCNRGWQSCVHLDAIFFRVHGLRCAATARGFGDRIGKHRPRGEGNTRIAKRRLLPTMEGLTYCTAQHFAAVRHECKEDVVAPPTTSNIMAPLITIADGNLACIALTWFFSCARCTMRCNSAMRR
jgi:hypothetical protein